MRIGQAFKEVKGKLYPSVGMKKSGEHVRVNFGQTPFIFDIDALMKACYPFFPYFLLILIYTLVSARHVVPHHEHARSSPLARVVDRRSFR